MAIWRRHHPLPLLFLSRLCRSSRYSNPILSNRLFMQWRLVILWLFSKFFHIIVIRRQSHDHRILYSSFCWYLFQQYPKTRILLDMLMQKKQTMACFLEAIESLIPFAGQFYISMQDLCSQTCCLPTEASSGLDPWLMMLLARDW